jgi:putative oligomerization/nucleic acid binding protein
MLINNKTASCRGKTAWIEFICISSIRILDCIIILLNRGSRGQNRISLPKLVLTMFPQKKSLSLYINYTRSGRKNQFHLTGCQDMSSKKLEEKQKIDGGIKQAQQFLSMQKAQAQQAQLAQAQAAQMQAAQTTTSQSQEPKKDVVQELQKLANLKQQGILSEEEFQQMKSRLLSSS